MYRFLLRQNIAHFEALIMEEESEAKRTTLEWLLAEAKAELRDLEELVAPEHAWRDAALKVLAEHTLDKGIELLNAQFGTLRVFDPSQHGLVILAQRNFRPQFLHHFSITGPQDGSVTGRAWNAAAPIVVEDITTDPSYTSHRQAAREAGIIAVAASPMRKHDGEIIGVLSTHFDHARKFSEHDIEALQKHANLAAEPIANQLQAAA